MPDIHVRNVGEELLRDVNVAAAKAGVRQREWIIAVLKSASTAGNDVVVRVPKREMIKKRVASPVIQVQSVRALSVVDRPYYGPPHAINCDCGACVLKKGAK